ncbi:unnamed protein product [Pleuronectes platessa]|uniref:Uncharacterized protein n=1 Tax=Pleuronectes platessa TaxID=8262 RepID=A0A9N7TGZ4_PLEPL|nr:unnamed protein product [Pleuronectes platessa]
MVDALLLASNYRVVVATPTSVLQSSEEQGWTMKAVATRMLVIVWCYTPENLQHLCPEDVEVFWFPLHFQPSSLRRSGRDCLHVAVKLMERHNGSEAGGPAALSLEVSSGGSAQ